MFWCQVNHTLQQFRFHSHERFEHGRANEIFEQTFSVRISEDKSTFIFAVFVLSGRNQIGNSNG